MGSAIDSNNTKMDATNGLISGAASEIGWLKARIEAMENQVAQTRLEDAAANRTATVGIVKVLEEKKKEEKAAAVTNHL